VYFGTDGSMILIDGTVGYVVRDGVIIAQQRVAGDGLTIVGYTA
jgi:hypothetical protein